MIAPDTFESTCSDCGSVSCFDHMLWRCPSLRGPNQVTEEEWSSAITSSELLPQVRAVQRAHDAAVRLQASPSPLKPSMVRIRSKQRPLAAGLAAEIECEAAGSRPAPAISWWRGKAKIPMDHVKVMLIGNRIFSVVAYTPTREDNGKRLRCVGREPQHHRQLNRGVVQPRHKPLVTLQLGKRLRLEEIFEGQDVYLECSIDANPRVSEVVWRFEGNQEVHSDPAAKVITSNQSLVFQAIRGRTRGATFASQSTLRGSPSATRFS
ncbi:hypothetical protein HPB47_001759 [Ixodes persulcatus]|uniref:Uncharacterized protein n=1 Tax=Ixodes persulcatus TaxID=34615 RepID=A0AC60PNI0_IXOPE|nr:hypothetical protein HPB47_001759 [Ixodes persulcatus]